MEKSGEERGNTCSLFADHPLFTRLKPMRPISSFEVECACGEVDHEQGERPIDFAFRCQHSCIAWTYSSGQTSMSLGRKD